MNAKAPQRPPDVATMAATDSRSYMPPPPPPKRDDRHVHHIDPIPCESSEQLATIRATLMVNFGKDYRNQYGIGLEDKGSTLSLLVTVLEHLVKDRPPESFSPSVYG